MYNEEPKDTDGHEDVRTAGKAADPHLSSVNLCLQLNQLAWSHPVELKHMDTAVPVFETHCSEIANVQTCLLQTRLDIGSKYLFSEAKASP